MSQKKLGVMCNYYIDEKLLEVDQFREYYRVFFLFLLWLLIYCEIISILIYFFLGYGIIEDRNFNNVIKFNIGQWVFSFFNFSFIFLVFGLMIDINICGINSILREDFGQRD